MTTTAKEADVEQVADLLHGKEERVWADSGYRGAQKRAERDLLQYIGNLPMQDMCNDALEAFKLDRLEDGVKHATINRSLEVVRTTLIRAARVWRDDGRPWLTTAPLIEMLDEAAQKREPYPITWAEQAKLLMRLPAHLQDMVEFSVNTGARDENVCGLRWAWEVTVTEGCAAPRLCDAQ